MAVKIPEDVFIRSERMYLPRGANAAAGPKRLNLTRRLRTGAAPMTRSSGNGWARPDTEFPKNSINSGKFTGFFDKKP